jgi:hypothetical protein
MAASAAEAVPLRRISDSGTSTGVPYGVLSKNGGNSNTAFGVAEPPDAQDLVRPTQLPYLALELAQPRALCGRHAVSASRNLRGASAEHPIILGDRPNGLLPRPVPILALEEHPERTLPQFLRMPLLLCRDPILSRNASREPEAIQADLPIPTRRSRATIPTTLAIANPVTIWGRTWSAEKNARPSFTTVEIPAATITKCPISAMEAARVLALLGFDINITAQVQTHVMR